jgi:exosortase/archaeosortase family protein
MTLFGKEIRSSHWFIFRAISLIVLWKVFYFLILIPFFNINEWLTNNVGNTTSSLFNVFSRESLFDGRYLFIEGQKSVIIADSCNGLEVYALFVGFIIMAPGRLITKIIYCLGGLAILFSSNILRVYLLGLNYLNNYSTFEFNHHYTYQGLIYLIIFALWLIWIEVINKKYFAKITE